MKQEEYEPLVKRTLADFDFVKVHKCMKFLGWEWHFGDDPHVPSVGELYQEAERLLVCAAQKECSCSSGGFRAYSDGTSVELCFSIAESGCAVCDLEESGLVDLKHQQRE